MSTPQIRVSFSDASGEHLTSLWVSTFVPKTAAAPSRSPMNHGQRIDGPPPVAAPVAVSSDGTITLMLLHDYPDFKPQSGWTVTGRNLNATITAVDGLKLTCRENT